MRPILLHARQGDLQRLAARLDPGLAAQGESPAADLGPPCARPARPLLEGAAHLPPRPSWTGVLWRRRQRPEREVSAAVDSLHGTGRRITIGELRARKLPARTRPLSKEHRHWVSLQNGATPWWCSGVTSPHRRLVENGRVGLLAEVASGEQGHTQTTLPQAARSWGRWSSEQFTFVAGFRVPGGRTDFMQGGALPVGNVERPCSGVGQAGGGEVWEGPGDTVVVSRTRGNLNADRDGGQRGRPPSTVASLGFSRDGGEEGDRVRGQRPQRGSEEEQVQREVLSCSL